MVAFTDHNRNEHLIRSNSIVSLSKKSISITFLLGGSSFVASPFPQPQSKRRTLIAQQVFLADVADFETMNSAYSQFFGLIKPTRAAIQAGHLVGSGSVEIKCSGWAPKPTLPFHAPTAPVGAARTTADGGQVERSRTWIGGRP